MSFYTIPLKAGQPYKQATSGTLVLIDSIGVAAGVDVQLTRPGGSDGTLMPGRLAAFRLVEPFDAVTFTAAVDTTINVFLSSADVQLGFASGGAVVVTNPAGQPIPVNFAGTVAPVIGTLNNDDAHAVPVVQKIGAVFTTQAEKLATIQDLAPVAVGIAATALVADATLKRLRIRNGHATANIGIGGAGVTLANAAIQLAPGDVWNEVDAAGAAWYAISDTAATNVQVQGVK